MHSKDISQHSQANAVTVLHLCDCKLPFLVISLYIVFALLLDRSREDYICTDEDLDLLQKFPRSNLKLEK